MSPRASHPAAPRSPSARRRIAVAIASFAALALAGATSTPVLAASIYHLRDLTPDAPADACAWGLNDRGQAVGYVSATGSGTDRVAMAWVDGQSIVLGPGYGRGIANDGTIVGNENPGSPRGQQGFIVRDGIRQPIDPRAGPRTNTVRAVGRPGICGWDTEAGVTQAMLVTPGGRLRALVMPEPTSWSGCMGVSSSGLETGMAIFTSRGGATLGFVGTPGHWTILENGDSNMVRPFAVNAAGTVTGDYAAPGFETRGFLYRDGVMSDLPRLPGSDTAGLAINDAGQVAGMSFGDHPTAIVVEADGTLVDLTAQIDPAQPGWVVDTAIAINRNGVVAGCGYQAGQPGRHAVLLTPMP